MSEPELGSVWRTRSSVFCPASGRQEHKQWLQFRMELTRLTSPQQQQVEQEGEGEVAHYRAAFDCFDRGGSGRMAARELQDALRRAGQNPTESEVQDMTNRVDDGQ